MVIYEDHVGEDDIVGGLIGCDTEHLAFVCRKVGGLKAFPLGGG